MRRLRAVPAWEWLVYGPALAFYVVFIGRTTFTYRGRTYFWLFDDAMISMRYARNFAEGHGLVWNPGERVEGYSNFLWTLVMSGVHAVGFSDTGASLAMMVIGAVLLLGATFVVGRICRTVAPGRELARGVAMALTASFYPLVYWTLRGLEVGLAALLIATAVLLALRLTDGWDRRAGWGLAATLAATVLTRDDLLLPAVLILAFVAWRVPRQARRRVLARLVGAVVVAVGAHTAFRLAYYGDALPNTYYLKLDGIGLWTRVRRGLTVVAYTWLQELYAPLLLAAALVLTRRLRLHRAAVLLGVLFLAQCAYCVYVGGDAFEAVRFSNRYIAPVVPLLAILAGMGLDELVRAPAERWRLTAGIGGAIGVVALLQVKDWLPTDLFDVPVSDGVNVLRPLAALVCAAVLVGSVALRRRTPTAGPRIAVLSSAVLALALMFAVNARPLKTWVSSNAQDVTLFESFVRQGVDIRDLTPPETTVAMTGAGNIAYFDHRPAIDLLGKMDPVVAKGPPKPIDFRPGHDKWNYPYSIGHLRPDVIAQMWHPTARDLCSLRAWGYRQIAPQVYVRGTKLAATEAELARRSRASVVVPALPDPSSCPVAGGP